MLGSFVEGQKFNPLFRSDISDSLSLVEEILQIASVVFILFLTAFHATSMLLFRSFFCKSAPLVSKRFESLILFVRFCVVFDFNLAERRGFFHGEDASLYVTTFYVTTFFVLTIEIENGDNINDNLNVTISQNIAKLHPHKVRGKS